MNENNKPWAWLTELFEKEKRTLKDRRIGLEVERLALWKDGSPFLYRSTPEKPGAGELLRKLNEAYGWTPVKNSTGDLIGLETPQGKVSLEPGSQVEFAVYPKKSLIEVAEELKQFDEKVERVIEKWKGLSFLGLGVNPLHSVEQLDLIPSPRYQIMTQVLGKTGKYGTSMMRRTSSVQVNLDYTSEEEAIEMLRVALSVAPVSTALFANSPFLDGKQTEFLSVRSEIWRHTDPARTGLLPEAFEKGFNFDSYSALLWRLPLMFVLNEANETVDACGLSLLEISKGKLKGVAASQANMRWAVQQLFTEARIKPGYIEIRSIDGQLPAYRLAAAAFWLGLLYSSEARKKALKLLGASSPKEREALWIESSRSGLRTQGHQGTFFSIVEELVAASVESLKKRGMKEEDFLIPLLENLKKTKNPADIVLEKFKSKWNQKLTMEQMQGEA